MAAQFQDRVWIDVAKLTDTVIDKADSGITRCCGNRPLSSPGRSSATDYTTQNQGEEAQRPNYARNNFWGLWEFGHKLSRQFA